jgi:hypothetical protein
MDTANARGRQGGPTARQSAGLQDAGDRPRRGRQGRRAPRPRVFPAPVLFRQRPGLRAHQRPFPEGSADRDTTADTSGRNNCNHWFISNSQVPTRGEGKRSALSADCGAKEYLCAALETA